MIPYDTGTWSIRLLCKLRGSVFPKAFVWSVPAAGNAVLIHHLWFDHDMLPQLETSSGLGAIWSSFTFVLGFLLVFRTQSAYSRYWEGATLVQQARASFFNCCSSLIAFCSPNRDRMRQTHEFQHLLVRLMSMLHCVGLQTVAEMTDVKFEFFNTDGMEQKYLRFLSTNTDKHQRCEIVIQWIQRLIIEGNRNGTLDVPAPILTRVFQELAQGASYIIHARNMTGIPFPFPYAQLLSALLLVHWALTPVFIVVVMKSPFYSAVFSFISTFAFFGVNSIAVEIESPFGDDPNDLPLHKLQKDMNKSLWILLHPDTQAVPKFQFDPLKHRKWDMICKANFNRVEDDARGILMTGRSKLWAQRVSQLRTNTYEFLSDLPSFKPSMKATLSSLRSRTRASATGSTDTSGNGNFHSGLTSPKVRVSATAESTSDCSVTDCSVAEFGEPMQTRFVAGEDELPLLDSECEKDWKASFTADLMSVEALSMGSVAPSSRGVSTTSRNADELHRSNSKSNMDLNPPHRLEKHPYFDAVQDFLENYITQTAHELVRLQETLRSNRKASPWTPAPESRLRSPRRFSKEQGLQPVVGVDALTEGDLGPNHISGLDTSPPKFMPMPPGLRRI